MYNGNLNGLVGYRMWEDMIYLEFWVKIKMDGVAVHKQHLCTHVH